MNNQNPNNIQNPNQNHACAACRYQRRKCNRDCPLAPYFPPDSQTKFLNAHKLFGVGNILKVIRALPDPKQKDTAMETMLIQSELRSKDPVLGCVRYIMDLQSQIAAHQNELNFVLNRIASFRAAAMNQNYDNVVHEGGYEGFLEHQESGGGGGGGGENGNFQKELNCDENEWRFMNENDSGLIENNGENGMSNMMMMMLMKQEGQDALVPVLEERQFFDDGFDQTNETKDHIERSSNENFSKVDEPPGDDDSVVQNEEKTVRKECNSSIKIKDEEDTMNTL